MTQGTASSRAGISILAILSIVVGVLTLAMMAVSMLVGWQVGERGWPAILLWCAIPISTVGGGLAVWSLVRQSERPQAAHYGLWINGLIAVFGVPVAMAWSLVS